MAAAAHWQGAWLGELEHWLVKPTTVGSFMHDAPLSVHGQLPLPLELEPPAPLELDGGGLPAMAHAAWLVPQKLRSAQQTG